MADPITGDVFSIEVQTGSGPIVYSEIAEVTSYDRNTQRSTSKTRVFGRATPRLGTGSREATYTIAALLSPEDPGQAALLAAEEADTPIMVRVFADGSTDGFEQSVKVSSKRHSAKADSDWQDITFDLVEEDDAAPVAGGIVI